MRILFLRGRPSHLSLTDFLRAREEFPLDHELRGPARAVSGHVILRAGEKHGSKMHKPPMHVLQPGGGLVISWPYGALHREAARQLESTYGAAVARRAEQRAERLRLGRAESGGSAERLLHKPCARLSERRRLAEDVLQDEARRGTKPVQPGTTNLVDSCRVEQCPLRCGAHAAVHAVGLGQFRREHREQLCPSEADRAAQPSRLKHRCS